MENWNKKLYIAAVDGDIETLKLCLQNGADIDYQHWNGETALLEAARWGHLEICRLLIDRGCKIDFTNVLGRTALMEAAEGGHLEICRLLIDRGYKIDITDGWGQTALMEAAEGGHLEICRLLIDRGCKIDITMINGYTALHCAAQGGHLQTTQYLVEQGASPLVTTREGETPYNRAAGAKQGQYEEVMKYLQTVMSEKYSGVTVELGIEDDSVPTEIKLMADKRSIDLYLKLLESGSEEKRDIRLVVVGKKGAGKTSLIRRLFGEDIQDVTSTNGIQIHTIKCKAKSDDGIWNKLDVTNEETEIHERLLKQYKGIIEASVEKGSHKAVKENTPSTSFLESKEPETVIQQPKIMKPPVTTESQVEPPVISQQQNQSVEQAKRDIETMLKSNVDLHDKEEYATLFLWDFAGDEEFYHTHQTFLSPEAIYLVVTKLNEAGDKNAQEMFQLWMNSIHCYCSQEEQEIKAESNTGESGKLKRTYLEPPVVLVGSYKDEVKISGEYGIEDTCKICLDKFVSNVSEDACRHLREEYFVSNTKDDENVFQRIRLEILDLARSMKRSWNKKYPIKFIQLEKSLQEEKKKLQIPIITFKEIKKISTKIQKPLSDDELLLYLKFHHEIRALVYFKDLPEYIILDTQWLSDAFKCIVTAKKHRSNVIRHVIKEKWEDLHNRGILHSEVLEDILKKDDNIFKFKYHILNVMEKFDIIICPNKSERGIAGEKYPYYVPCMINAEPEGDIYDMFHVSESCRKSTWLCYTFIFLPPHLKNHLIASLSRKYEIAEVPVCGPNKRPIALFKGTAVFKLREATNLLVMFFYNQIQIQVLEFNTNQIIDKCYYKNIAEFVTSEIKRIISKRFKMTTVIFDQKLECFLQKPDCVKGSCEWKYIKTDYFCDICTKRHDNEWAEHQPVKPPKSFKAASVVKSDTESTSLSQCISKNEPMSPDTKVDFRDILDQMMTKLVISVDDRRTIEQNTDPEKKLFSIMIDRGEPNKSVCIDVLKQNSGYEDLTEKLLGSPSSVPPPTKTDLEDVPAYKIRLQKNYLKIIETLKHNQ